MSKIQEVVSIKSGYANFVELKEEFEKTQENEDRMAMYRPTKSHREAFEQITRGLFQPNDKKFYLLSGSYGTGKSHLCLMTANVLSRASSDPAIAGFYDNYEKLDAERAKQLRNKRKSGQYLVAICDYNLERPFEDMVLKAVFEACRAKGFDPEVDTQFDEAERFLSQWEQQGDSGGFRNFYKDFEKALETVSPGMTVQGVRAGLKDYDSGKLKVFREAYRKMMGGVEFKPNAENLIPILRTLLRSEKFKERFLGLAVFFDEFGFTLEKGNYSKAVMQGFMEKICKNETNVMFVGCIHKDFRAYADRLSKDDATVMWARLNQVDLRNEGIEEIIGAIVETEKESQVWKEEVEPKTTVFDQLLPKCQSLNLFPWIEDTEHIRSRVLEDIYGVHPAALSCLLTLSSEIGSDARSTFTFFSKDQPGSYLEFIQNNDVTGVSGKPNLYTVNRLVTFFKSELSPGNPDLREIQRHTINGFQASVDAFRKSQRDELSGLEEDERLGVLRTVLVYSLCSIPASAENITFGLYAINSAEKKVVKRYLEELRSCGALFYRKQSETYELASGVGEDPYDLIEQFIEDSSLHPEDMLDEFFREAATRDATQFVEAKSYNVHFTEDKRCRPHYVAGRDLGEELWEELKNDFEKVKNDPAKSYEGTLVYTVCESESEIDSVKQNIQNLKQNNLAVAVPTSPVDYRDTLLKVKACRYYLSPDCPQKISAQTESRLNDILHNQSDGFLPQLKRMFEQVSSGAESCWYTAGGEVLIDRPQQPHEPASKMCEHLFAKRCRIKHDDLNRIHDERWRKKRNQALKQAVDVLLSAEQVLVDNGNPESHGQKRYLKKVLLEGAGALQRTGSEGNVTYFHCERDPAAIHDSFPVLQQLASQLSAVEPGKSFKLGEFLSSVRQAPYGASGNQLVLAVAHIIRAYGERLSIYSDTTQSVEQPVRSFDDLVDIISDPAPKTVFKVREITDLQIKLVEAFAEALGAPALKHGEQRSIQAVYNHLFEWWRELPPVSGIVSLYDSAAQPRIRELKNLLGSPSADTDRFTLLLEKLPVIYTAEVEAGGLSEEQVASIGDTFKADVQRMNNAVAQVEQRVAETVSEAFGSQGDIIVCEQTVRQWFKNLNPRQRDPNRYDDSDATSLVHRLLGGSDFRNIITALLPEDFGFGAVRNWTSLHLEDYKAKLQQAKGEVEKAQVEVPAPEPGESEVEISEGEPRYIPVPEGAAKIVYTIDNSDPRNAYTAETADYRINLTELLSGKPNVNVKMRSVDNEGNYSDPVTVRVTNKARKHEIQLNKDNSLYNENEAYFTFPEDRQGLVAVIKSLLLRGKERGLLSSEDTTRVEQALDELESGGA